MSIRHFLLVPALALSVAACGSTDTKTAAPAASSSSSSSAPSSNSSSSKASTPTPSPTKTKANVTNLPLGTPITVSGKNGTEDFAMTVTAVSTQTSAKALEQYGSKPEKGKFVGILIEYSCTTGTCSYNPFDFTLRAPDGTESDKSFFGNFKPDLQSGKIGAGTKAKGSITFDLPAGTYNLEYRTNFLDGNAASWVVTAA